MRDAEFLEFTNADLRIRLQGMPARVRSAGLWFAKGRMPEVRQQETSPKALRIRRFSAGDFDESTSRGRRLRHLRRPPRAGRLLDELGGFGFRGKGRMEPTTRLELVTCRLRIDPALRMLL